MSDETLSLRIISGAPSRTEALVRMLTEDIQSGRLKPGQRIPTEQELVVLAGVSRTVVREAVAALRADGLLVTRQGIGAFVATTPGQGRFRIEPREAQSLERVVHVLDLRIGIEVEAAGLAAERAVRDEIDVIAAKCAEFDRTVRAGSEAVSADFAFHLAIFDATHNPFFPRFLNSLGQVMIPRESVRFAMRSDADKARYLAKVNTEHEAIVQAIQGRDAAGARRAMREHLSAARNRYRALADAVGETLKAKPRKSDETQ